MGQMLVLTFIADDRSGLVERLSDIVSDGGGNWLESRMAHLAAKFAGVVRIDVPADRADDLRTALAALEAEGFRIAVETAGEETTGAEKKAAGPLLLIDLVGPDQPGIVHEITRCLADKGVSVEEMETDIRDAPMAGGALFYARLSVRAPQGLDEVDLRQAIEEVAGALMVDIDVTDDPDF